MRPLLLLLVLANLAFFAWTRWLAPVDPAAIPSRPLTAPRVMLVGERAGGAQANVAAARGAAARRCVSVGPFPGAEEAAQTAGRLGPSVLEARTREESTSVSEGYWVYVGGFESAAAVMAALRRMRRDGLTEVAAMPPSSEGRQISAGIFSERERAEQVAARVRALGLEPAVAERTRTAIQHWVDLDLAPAADLPPEAQQGMQEGSRLQAKPCPPPVEAPPPGEAGASGGARAAAPQPAAGIAAAAADRIESGT